MHLLFATSIVPDGRLGSGYEIANEAILGSLRRLGVRVTVLGFAWPDRPASDPAQTITLGELDVRTESASALKKVGWLLRAIREKATFSSAKLRTVSDETVRAAIDSIGPVDGYILNSVQFAGAFEACFQDRPVLFVAHNVEAQSARENAASVRDAVQRWMYRREAKLLQALEARLCRQARFVFTLAEEDRAALGLASPEKSAALPLVTRSDSPPARLARAPVAVDAALIGTWTWQPNRVGLEWYLNEVTPHLPPGFRTRIAGSVPSGISSNYPGVEFVGRVHDARDFLASAAVIPLVSRGGTGVQLKTIETFEMGLASVATASAVRGIDYRPPNCVLADDAKEFADALCRMAKARPAPIDGRIFHEKQRSELDRRIGEGLARLGWIQRAVFA